MARNIATPRKCGRPTYLQKIYYINITHTRHRTKTKKQKNNNKKTKQKQKQKNIKKNKNKNKTQHRKSKRRATRTHQNSEVKPGAREWQAVPASHKTTVMPLIQSRLNHSVKYFQYYKYEHVLTVNMCQEEFEDTKGVIRIGISKKNRYNGRRYQRSNQNRYIEEEQTTQ